MLFTHQLNSKSKDFFFSKIAGQQGDVWHIGCFQTVKEDPSNPGKFITQNDIFVSILGSVNYSWTAFESLFFNIDFS